MRKILTIIFVLIFLSCLKVWAEEGADTMGGRQYGSNQVWTIGYNGSGSDISSNYVVIVDTTAANIASGSTLGAYITTTTTAGDGRVLGVTDEVIENGTSGRICIRGPHKCAMQNGGRFVDTALIMDSRVTVGASLATSTTAGHATGACLTSADRDGAGKILGFLLSTGNVYSNTYGKTLGEGDANFWIWVGKR